MKLYSSKYYFQHILISKNTHIYLQRKGTEKVSLLHMTSFSAMELYYIFTSIDAWLHNQEF